MGGCVDAVRPQRIDRGGRVSWKGRERRNNAKVRDRLSIEKTQCWFEKAVRYAEMNIFVLFPYLTPFFGEGDTIVQHLRDSH